MNPARYVTLALLTVAGLLALSAAFDPSVGIGPSRAPIAVVVDRSASMRGVELGPVDTFIAELVRQVGPDRVRIYGAASTVQEIAAYDFSLPAERQLPAPNEFDPWFLDSRLAEAVESVVAPSNRERPGRLVLASDGVVSDVDRTTVKIAAAGIPLDTIGLTGPQEPEAAVIRVEGPSAVTPGSPAELSATVYSSHRQTALLEVSVGGRRIVRELTLQPGTVRVPVTVGPLPRGYHSVRVDLEPAADTFGSNNQGQASIWAGQEESVLLVADSESPPAWSSWLTDGGRLFEYSPIGSAPVAVDQYLEYPAVILDDVSAVLLSADQQEALRRYVAVGGGLVVFGGPRSYSAGAYQESLLADVLPVDLDIAGAVEVPDLALVYVLDASGSMGNYVSGGKNKLQIVKEATRASINLLTGYQKVGVLSFDIRSDWVLPLGPTDEASQLPRLFASLNPGGGTRLDRALETALEALAETPATARHIIVLSDGLTDDEDLRPVTDRLVQAGVSVTAVGVGADVDQALLRELTSRTGGRVYFTNDSRDVPAVFTSETAFVSTGLVRNQQEFVVPGDFHPIGQSLETAILPPVGGLNLSFPKPGTQVILKTPLGNPILATGTFGAGRVVAYTSSMSGDWVEPFLEWPDLPQMVVNAVDWSIQQGVSEPAWIDAELSGGSLRVVAIPKSREKTPTGATAWVQWVRTGVSAPGGQSRGDGSFPLTMQPDGSFTGSVPDNPTAHRAIVRVSLTYSRDDGAVGADTGSDIAGGAQTTTPAEGRTEWSAPVSVGSSYPVELMPAAADLDLLGRLSSVSSGVYMAASDLEGDVRSEVAEIVGRMPNRRRSISTVLLVAAALLFVAAVWIWGLASGISIARPQNGDRIGHASKE